MILDTTVLVDLQREFRRGQPGPATRLLETSGDAACFVSFVTWMEFAEGFADHARGACEAFLAAFQVVWPDADVAWRAARVSRTLRALGTPIGDHDLWIAALPWSATTLWSPGTKSISGACRGCRCAPTESRAGQRLSGYSSKSAVTSISKPGSTSPPERRSVPRSSLTSARG